MQSATHNVAVPAHKRRALVIRCVTFAAAMGLAGCADLGSDIATLGADIATLTRRAPPAAIPAPQPPPAPVPEIVAPVVETPPPPPAVAELPRPAPLTLGEIGPLAELGPEVLVGLEPDQVAALLGTPTTVAERPPATVWEYAATTCSLSVLFYRDLNNDRSRALGYDFSPSLIAPEARARCIAALRAARK